MHTTFSWAAVTCWQGLTTGSVSVDIRWGWVLVPSWATKALASQVLPSCHFAVHPQSQRKLGTWVSVLARVQDATSQLPGRTYLEWQQHAGLLPVSLATTLEKGNTVQKAVVPVDKDTPTGTSLLFQPHMRCSLTGPASAWSFIPPFSPPELGYFTFFLCSFMRIMYFISTKWAVPGF